MWLAVGVPFEWACILIVWLLAHCVICQPFLPLQSRQQHDGSSCIRLIFIHLQMLRIFCWYLVEKFLRPWYDLVVPLYNQNKNQWWGPCQFCEISKKYLVAYQRSQVTTDIDLLFVFYQKPILQGKNSKQVVMYYW